MWVVICGRKSASIVILALCDGLKDRSQADLPKRLALLGPSLSILGTDKNSNGKVAALSLIAPPSQAFFTVPIDPLFTVISPLLLAKAGASKPFLFL